MTMSINDEMYAVVGIRNLYYTAMTTLGPLRWDLDDRGDLAEYALADAIERRDALGDAVYVTDGNRPGAPNTWSSRCPTRSTCAPGATATGATTTGADASARPRMGIAAGSVMPASRTWQRPTRTTCANRPSADEMMRQLTTTPSPAGKPGRKDVR